MLTKAAGYLVAALALALLCACGAAWWFYDSAEDRAVQLEAAKAERDAVAVSIGKCRVANTGWQHALDTTQAAIKACIQQRDDARETGAREVAKAQAVAAQTRADGEAWRRRFDAAARDPDCAQTLEAQLCPAVSDY